jgi:hypothetical protein
MLSQAVAAPGAQMGDARSRRSGIGGRRSIGSALGTGRWALTLNLEPLNP